MVRPREWQHIPEFTRSQETTGIGEIT